MQQNTQGATGDVSGATSDVSEATGDIGTHKDTTETVGDNILHSLLQQMVTQMTDLNIGLIGMKTEILNAIDKADSQGNTRGLPSGNARSHSLMKEE